MKTSDVFLIALYGIVLCLAIYFITGLYRPVQKTVVIREETPVYQESVWWPWAGASYNYWPGWFPWGGRWGSSGYYGRGSHWDNNVRPRWGSGTRPWGRSGVRNRRH